MSEQKMTYPERLEIEKKAAAITVNSFTENLIFDTEPEIIEAAKSNVASQAEAIREALTYSFSSFIYALHPLSANEMKGRIDRYLQEHGYIEPKTDEDAK